MTKKRAPKTEPCRKASGQTLRDMALSLSRRTPRHWFHKLTAAQQKELLEMRDMVYNGEVALSALHRAAVSKYGISVQRAQFSRWFHGELPE